MVQLLDSFQPSLLDQLHLVFIPSLPGDLLRHLRGSGRPSPGSAGDLLGRLLSTTTDTTTWDRSKNAASRKTPQPHCPHQAFTRATQKPTQNGAAERASAKA